MAPNSGDSTENSEIVEYYDSIVNSSEWINEESRAVRGEMLQLSEEMIESMSTDELVEAVLEYPFFSDVFAFDNIQDGIEIMFNTFNGLEALADRCDAATVLLDKYANTSVLHSAEETDDFFRLTFLEILISQECFFNTLSTEEMESLYNLSLKKYEEKSESSLYSSFTENVFYEMLEINVGEDVDSFITSDLTSEISATIDSVSEGKVTTPNGTKVAVYVYSSEPLTSTEISSINSSYDKSYPNATRLRSATGKYNCHSYAWHSKSKSNNKWMNDPSSYWKDGSYSKIAMSEAAEGDKITYKKSGNLKHSAIVKTRYAGPSQNGYIDMAVVKSKGGKAGLYRHNGADSPYDACDTYKCYT